MAVVAEEVIATERLKPKLALSEPAIFKSCRRGNRD